MKKLFLLFIFGIVVSCGKESKVEKEIASIPIQFDIERFDLAFANSDSSDLSKLKNVYPFMFSQRYSDTIWIQKMRDTLQQELAFETKKGFNDFQEVKEDISQLFQHIKYYKPEFITPRVITATSSVDYRNKVIVTDTIVLVSLDTYLGSDHKFYIGIQQYLRQNFNKDQIVVDMAGEYSKKYIYQQQNKKFLDEMIYFGKQLYFKDLVIPFKTDAEKIGYTEEQIQWAIANESYIWRYFVERELLYSTDFKLANRFIAPAPFSKFQLQDIDNESPGRIGQYIGWQIVRAYMNNNDVSLNDMLSENAEDIFINSKFKPRK